MLQDFGLQEIAQHYGLLYALIPLFIGGIILGLVGAFGNERLYWPSPNKSKDSFKDKMRALTITFIVMLFFLAWYIFSFHISWWLIIILIIAAIVMSEPYLGHDSLISIDKMSQENEIYFNLLGSFGLLILILVFATMIHLFQDIAGLHEDSLDNQEQKTYYIQNNDLKAFDVVESKIDIDPLYRVGIYLDNLKDESVKSESILLLRDMQKSKNYSVSFSGFLFGVESFIRKKYERSESIFKNLGYTRLSDISKILSIAPLISRTGIQKRYLLQEDLISNAKDKFAEEFNSIISDKTPGLPKEKFTSNFKWFYWYNLMQAVILFHVVSFTFLLIGAFLIRKTLKPEYQN